MARRLSCLSIAALLLGLSLSSPALAADKQAGAKPLPAPIVATIDVQRVMQESQAAKSVQKQLEAQRAKFQTEIAAEETSLRKAEQDLAKARDTVPPDVFAEREQQLRQRFLAVEKQVQARRKALDQAFTESMNAVRKSFLDIVGGVAHEHGANLVIVKQQVLWSDKAMDITEESLARLNKSMPQVQVKVVTDEGKP